MMPRNLRGVAQVSHPGVQCEYGVSLHKRRVMHREAAASAGNGQGDEPWVNDKLFVEDSLLPAEFRHLVCWL